MTAPDQLTTRSRPALAWLLRAVCAVMFIGHGLMCWNGQMPLRALLWDEGLVSGVVQRIAGIEWDVWVSSMEIDAGICDGMTYEQIGIRIGRTTVASRCLVQKAKRKLRLPQYRDRSDA